ncbi:MAG: exonuclease domain-containing protein [Vicingaceae bacterium]|nr:MAG: exonuclease domain-containing protein [Vicingaceae bacterium]
MKLNLNKPICFFGLETTGVNIGTDRIVEISILKINPNQTEETYTRRINPEIPIPHTASMVHGIYNDDVKNEPTFQQLAKEISTFIGNADLAGFNSNKFDIPLLVEEMLRVGIDFDLTNRKLIDIQNIFHKMEQRNLAAAYKFYCEKDLINAHSAEADIKATYEILQAQLERYNELKNDISFLHDFCERSKNVDLAGRIIYNDSQQEIFNFGKHKGKLVEEVLKKEPSYYNWMMDGDFPLYTKKVLTTIRLRSLNSKSN